MEGFWGNAKEHIKLMHSIKEGMLGSHLDEMSFHWNHHDVDLMAKLLELIALFYPCDNRGVPVNLLAAMPQIHL